MSIKQEEWDDFAADHFAKECKDIAENKINADTLSMQRALDLGGFTDWYQLFRKEDLVDDVLEAWKELERRIKQR